jgi:anti-sigma regulatory factor (Ser/Thr protein kinase)
MPNQQLLILEDSSQIASARRAASELAAALNFDETRTGKVALAVTEAATNILKHAEKGRLLLRALETESDTGIEVLALDQGPGIANISASLRDGHSTAGSLGAGLGALVRLADDFQIYSTAGRGTALRLEFWAKSSSHTDALLQTGAVCLPKAGESVSGDAWKMASYKGHTKILVADGLGHGPDAAKAAIAATNVLKRHADATPIALIEECHAALRSTRGAAVGIVGLDPAGEQGSFAGVGNVACRVESLQGPGRNLVSYNGTLGHSLRKVQEFTFPFPRNALLILHTDGLGTHWELASYPGLALKHAGLSAGTLYRDYDRGRDDVTVVVVRNIAGG